MSQVWPVLTTKLLPFMCSSRDREAMKLQSVLRATDSNGIFNVMHCMLMPLILKLTNLPVCFVNFRFIHLYMVLGYSYCQFNSVRCTIVISLMCKHGAICISICLSANNFSVVDISYSGWLILMKFGRMTGIGQ